MIAKRLTPETRDLRWKIIQGLAAQIMLDTGGKDVKFTTKFGRHPENKTKAVTKDEECD